MDITDQLKVTDIKNCTRYYFDGIIRARNRDIYSREISLGEKNKNKNKNKNFY